MSRARVGERRALKERSVEVEVSAVVGMHRLHRTARELTINA